MITEQDIKFPDIPFGKTAVLIVLGLAIYFVYLYVVGFDSVMNVLRHANYWYIVLAMLVVLVSNAFHTAGWWVYLRNVGYKISFMKAYQMYLSSIFFVNVVPTMAVSGEVSKIYFIQKSTPDTRFDKTLATCLISRVLEIIPIATGATVGVLYMAFFYGMPLWATIFCLFIALVMVSLAIGGLVVAMDNALLRRLTGAAFRLLGRLLKRDLSVQAEQIDVILMQFDTSLKGITGNKALIAGSLLLIFTAWCLDVSVAYIAFMAVGSTVSPMLVITVFSVMVILQMLPLFLPGGIGVVDIVMTTLYMTVGIQKETAAGATMIVRFVTLWFLTAVGGLVTLYLVKAHGKNGVK
ncbi:MAG TPA: lysylphosphatidylglycerol synthase transmembrane domain-containing protein [Methanocella sp.]|uniref:lysylphosphatidylglycerol synthase transmembrane domain-containing protein n=1 Tax=Methanocella sp. TaxID=2052833 RepID=UPI002B6C6C3C|nr:lysylphosphatidylglycerol synthase transmembrane domain-containing protein [Methanocella sp.]HTY90527.1 lysylphosphatidylglycerol synthase transmembrane domain-containing protein [Methanocella sp.]